MRKITGIVAIIGSLLISGCLSTAPYDQRAYETAVDLKVDSLLLMNDASEHYTQHADEAQAILLRIQRAYEYAKGRPGNLETTMQWAKMMDPDDKLMAGFVADWQNKGTIKPVMIENKKEMMGDAYDTIIDLEAAKIKKQGIL
ncbi:MAG: hypothetical protein AB7E95_08865 [Kiritimatiellales bacterium]